MESCLLRIHEAAPLIRAYLVDHPSNELDAWILLVGLHVLAEARDVESFVPLLVLLTQPADELDWILGDCVTETLSKVVASLFNGDEQALFQSIRRPDQDTFVRSALLGAATVLTRDGRIERPTMGAFLKTFALETHWEETDWSSWLEAVGLLGFLDLRLQAEWAFSTGAASKDLYDLEWLNDTLAAAILNPSAPAPFERCGLGYIDNAVESLSWVSRYNVELPPFSTPTLNTLRNIGRNDSCPCGSGLKFKKCCLNLS